jgi:hypothetical protein
MKSVLFTILISYFSIVNAQINWRSGSPTGTQWASACDFKNSDLSNRQVASSSCAQTCANTQRCTHFSWTSYNGGTCWMKSGSVSKSNAVYNGNNGMVCGIISSNILNYILFKIYDVI